MTALRLPVNTLRRLFPGLLGLLLLPAVQSVLAQRAPSDADLEALNAAITQVQERIASMGSQRAGVYTELQGTEKQLADLNRELSAIRERISTQQAELDRLETEQDRLRELKRSQQDRITQYLRSAYRTGRQEYLKLLLNQENIAESARTLRYYQYFNQARSRQVETYGRTIASLAELEADIVLTTDELKREQQALVQKQISFSAARDRRQTLLDQLDSELADSGKQLEALEAERVEMALLIEELRRSIATLALGDQQQPFAELKGRLPWPLEGSIRNRYGASVGLGDLDWRGITINAKEGDSVQAIHHGRVVYSDWFSNSGLLLIIDHGDGYMSLYAHNQQLYKDVGEWVTAGEVIAAVGNTGGREDFGLYFEIRHNGESQNPETWCIARK